MRDSFNRKQSLHDTPSESEYSRFGWKIHMEPNGFSAHNLSQPLQARHSVLGTFSLDGRRGELAAAAGRPRLRVRKACPGTILEGGFPGKIRCDLG